MLAAVLLTGTLTGTALPAQAATPGWRQVFSKHYGAAGNYPQFDAVVALSAKNAWALGGTNAAGGALGLGRPVAEHWNGRAWSQFAMPKGVTSFVIAASAPAGGDIWAVTLFGGYVLHWNGRAWSVAKRLPVPKGSSVQPELTGVVALSATNVWVFGGSGMTLGWGTWHYNGRAWSRWHGNAADITDGSAVSRTNIWAIGGLTSPQSAIVHYTGTWKLEASPVLSGLQFNAIHAFSARNVWASAITAHNGSQSWLVHYNGQSWSKFKLPWSVTPNGGHIASDGHGGLWLSAFAFAQGQPNKQYEVHRTAKGAWGRTQVSAQLFGLAAIPGTASVWGGGAVYGTTGGTAVIWADGPV